MIKTIYPIFLVLIRIMTDILNSCSFNMSHPDCPWPYFFTPQFFQKSDGLSPSLENYSMEWADRQTLKFYRRSLYVTYFWKDVYCLEINCCFCWSFFNLNALFMITQFPHNNVSWVEVSLVISRIMNYYSKNSLHNKDKKIFQSFNQEQEKKTFE